MAKVMADQIGGSADPAGVTIVLQRLEAAQPDAGERLAADPELLGRVVTVSAASPALARLCITDPAALDVLSDVTRRPALEILAPDVGEEREKQARPSRRTPGADASISRWKQLELLRLAARDLAGEVDLEWVGASLASLADDVLGAAWQASGAGGLAIIGMGKLGAQELNYASDIDLLLVGEGDPRGFLEIVRHAWKVDLDLRPEGRAGPVTRSLASYLAYWERWASTWEFQALLKARPIAGDPDLGAHFAMEASERVWGRRFGVEELREVRAMKARAEEEVVRRGLSGREIKRGPGGIRDIEFAVQLLQLVHGRADPTLRVPATLPALKALREGGYVATEDADRLDSAYRWLRSVEHRLQLFEERQVHTVPDSAARREHLARVLGFRDDSTPALAQFDARLRAELASVRSIHERLFFRP
ncbi:MAG: bifunctional [glutamine synthetase] adenylyltransferase/[glutamine synthetase]-adenylyl-L-tyrosine phosphorylase, partial [Acidimicrobiales bacterium]